MHSLLNADDYNLVLIIRQQENGDYLVIGGIAKVSTSELGGHQENGVGAFYVLDSIYYTSYYKIKSIYGLNMTKCEFVSRDTEQKIYYSNSPEDENYKEFIQYNKLARYALTLINPNFIIFTHKSEILGNTIHPLRPRKIQINAIPTSLVQNIEVINNEIVFTKTNGEIIKKAFDSDQATLQTLLVKALVQNEEVLDIDNIMTLAS